MHNRNSFAFVLTRASSVPQMLVCVSCQATVDGERPVSHVKMDNCDCTLCNDCLLSEIARVTPAQMLQCQCCEAKVTGWTATKVVWKVRRQSTTLVATPRPPESVRWRRQSPTVRACVYCLDSAKKNSDPLMLCRPSQPRSSLPRSLAPALRSWPIISPPRSLALSPRQVLAPERGCSSQDRRLGRRVRACATPG